tara:strand:+ start:155361 stop:156383 length:1023 start_codon:yes stop_codon:yes gene_type:complete
MKKRMLAGLGALVTAASLAMPAGAEVPITLNAGFTQWGFDGDRRLEDDATPWLGLEYAISDQWAAEIFYSEDDVDRDGSPFTAEVTTWQVGALYYGGSYIGEGNRVRPFASMGLGELDLDYGVADSVETTAHAGAGLRWMLTPRFGARVEARLLHSLDEGENDFLFNAGVNYYFGKVSAPAAAAPAAPVDSDGDGVVDGRDKCPGTPAGTRVDADGCPLPVEKIASIKLKVNFDFDSTEVKERYFSDIRELAEFLKRFNDLQVEVEGHTDSIGPEAYNQGLSERRAKAVVELLVNQHGITASRLKPVGYGESRPVASNDTKAGRAENRRVMATLEVEYTD